MFEPLGQNSLNFDSIKQTLKDYLVENSTIQDVDYDGSNASILVDLLTYAIYALNSNQSTIVSEMFLDTATQRKNILHIARNLNYKVERPVSSKMDISLTITPSTDGSYNLEKGTEFTVGDYTFVNTEDYLFTEATPTQNITLTEGTYIDYNTDPTFRFITTVDSVESFVVPYQDVENNNIKLRVKYPTETAFSDYWEEQPFFLKLDSEQNYFVAEVDPDTGYTTIYIRFANQGVEIPVGTTIDVTVILSSGDEANGEIECELSPVQDSNNVSITPVITVSSVSYGGTTEESDDSIKVNAPKFYNSAFRAVNGADYDSILEKNSLVNKAISWGGESETPAQLGYIYFSCEPQATGQLFLTDLEIASLIDYLKEFKIDGTARRYLHTNYIYFDFNITLLGTIIDITEKQTQISNTLETLFSDELNVYRVSLYQSYLIQQINALFDKNASVTVEMQPKLLVTKDMFAELGVGEYWRVFIPNSAKRFYLSKDGERIEYPKNYNDLLSYAEAGWVKVYEPNEIIDITFDGTFKGLVVTTGTTETINGEDGKRVYIDGVERGYFMIGDSQLFLQQDIDDLLVAGDEEFININFSKINVRFERNTLLKLGNITYVS